MIKANEYKPGYKYTPLGWMPAEWDFLIMENVADVTRLAGYEYSEYWVENASGDILALKGENIGNNKIIKKNLSYISNELSQKLSRSRLYKGDIAFPCVGTIGNAYLVTEDDKFHINQNIAKISPKKGIADSLFITQYLMSNYCKKEIQRFNATTSQPNVLVGSLRNFRILIPPFIEQRRIASILSKWDDAINKTQQLIAQLQQRKNGLMQQLLKPKDDWKEKRLSEIFDRVVRKNTNANTNVITISAQRGFVKQKDFFKKQIASETLDNYFLVRKGEFCYNKSYSNGYDWGATKRLNDFDEAVVTTLYICFRITDEKKYSGDYFEYFFDANILDRGLAKIAHEGGRAHGLLNVTPSDFFSLKIHVPNYDEQVRLFKILSAAKKELKLTKQKLAALQEQKKGLMQKLLTGEIRVKL